ncbi:MAG: SusD/RagB family nutrient-binding outer membrane lipoprotein [Bacteroidetes bacterium]|nr:SusD/RagB family nutrient-binding outer membrane lipoprotein [Bacteroidota bacterium]
MINKSLKIGKYLLFAVIASASMTSCRQDLEKINTNPNSTDKPTSFGLFNYANKAFMDNTRDGFTSGRMTLPWVQYSAQRNYTEEDKYQYRLSVANSMWTNLYAYAMDYKKIIELNTDPSTATQQSNYGPNANQIAAARIMLANIFITLTDSFGDVPYYSYGTVDPDFQALDPKNITPKFASQAKIYADILKELKAASDMIKTDQVVFTNGDVLFGDGVKLKRFANSLRLRLGVRVKGVVPGADVAIQEAIASGVMQSNDDTVGLTYENTDNNPSPMWTANLTRNDFAINKTLVELLKGNKGPFGKTDPRLFQWAAPLGVTQNQVKAGSYEESTDPADYAGMPYGVPTNGIAANQSAIGRSSLFSKNIVKKNYTEVYMEYAEVEFLLSEVNGWSQTNYEKGVKASMERWGVPAADITAYLLGLAPASKETVLTQKYLALFGQPYEAWSEYRRTGYPKTLLLPGQTGSYNTPVTVGGVTSTTYTFNSLITGLTDLPTRFFYPTQVQTLNKANWEAASTAIGGDKMSSKLIWDKN